MIKLFSFLFLFFSITAMANPAFEENSSKLQHAKTEQELAAEKVIDKLIEAYNDQNIKAFLSLYDEDVEFYMYPQTLMFKGKKQLIKRYGLMFKKMKCLRSKSIKRITHGSIVIDHETSEICTKDAKVIDKTSEFVTSYQIEDDKIKKVVFFR